MSYHLIVVHPFGKYTKGQHITDENEIAKLSSENEHNCVRINAPSVSADVSINTHEDDSL